MARARERELPRRQPRCCRARAREHLLAVYGFARLVDELGDSTRRGDRLAALDWLEAELDRALAGTRRAPADGARSAPTAARRARCRASRSRG